MRIDESGDGVINAESVFRIVGADVERWIGGAQCACVDVVARGDASELSRGGIDECVYSWLLPTV